VIDPTRLQSCFYTLSMFEIMSTAQDKRNLRHPPGTLILPEVHADGNVPFRFRAPNAREVQLEREGLFVVSIAAIAHGSSRERLSCCHRQGGVGWPQVASLRTTMHILVACGTESDQVLF